MRKPLYAKNLQSIEIVVRTRKPYKQKSFTIYAVGTSIEHIIDRIKRGLQLASWEEKGRIKIPK